MTQTILQYILYLAIPIALAIPLGIYISKVMGGEKVFLSPVLAPCEGFIYKLLRIDKEKQMTWKDYLVAVLAFSLLGFVFLFLILMLQGYLPLNPQNAPGMSWDLAFNTAVSFITNTNWQSYSGEMQASNFSQMLGLTVQNFLSAAVGISVLFALIRGFVIVKSKALGNFWVDMTRSVLYVLLPLSLVAALLLVGGGVVQSLSPSETTELLEPVAVDRDGQVMEDALIDSVTGKVTIGGVEQPEAQIVTTQLVPLAPAASQVAIKQLGTNGGGVMGANSAHPLENPNAFTNLVEMLSIILIPMALCFSFGRSIKSHSQGRAIFFAMLLLLICSLSLMAVSEQAATPQLLQGGQVDPSLSGQPGGNMEGKEERFGIAGSATWSSYTTAASNGGVNSMLDSYTPLGGMVNMLQIQLGEVIFGGVGSGLYGMLAFAILTVFIAGLMVGRTPEYLGKKIEPFEMKWAVLMCLATPVCILAGSGIAAALPQTMDSLKNSGAHGFSEMLYAFSSAGGNNGSAFAGLQSNTVFLNVILGVIMLVARFVPIAGALAIAGSLGEKKRLAVTEGTLSTNNAMFVFLLIFVVLLIGALSFFPALALGPIAEHISMAS